MVESDLKDIYLGAVETDNLNDVRVYIINISDEPKTVQLLQGSFDGDDDGLLDLGHSPYKDLIIPAKGFVEIDHMEDGGELDFTTHYNIRFGDTEYMEDISGRSFLYHKPVVIPILNKKGYFSGFNKIGK